MIYGIGIDIVETERMKSAAVKWGDRFLRRIFTEKEIAHCFEKKDPYPSLSARFAAKEAVIKAIGGRRSIPWTDIEVCNDPHGKPVLTAGGKLDTFLREQSIERTHLSLSHERKYAVATVVLEK